jgi:hypothetical protein
MWASPEAVKASQELLASERFRQHFQHWPVGTRHYSAEATIALAFDAFADAIRAEQHAADVKALRDNMHLFLPIHEGMDVVRRVADFLEQRGPK